VAHAKILAAPAPEMKPPSRKNTVNSVAVQRLPFTMSTTRLTFLYPPLFRSIRASEPATGCARGRSRALQKQGQARSFATAESRNHRFVQRHGKAAGHFMTESRKRNEAENAKNKNAKDAGNDTQGSAAKEESKEEAGKPEPIPYSKAVASGPLSDETLAAMRLPGDLDQVPDGDEKSSVADKASLMEQVEKSTGDSAAPLETVLQMPAPQDQTATEKAPHLQAPPYVHHFDTYTLVQQVEAGGFTTDQSITAMKAVRGLLALNLDVAKAGLISKYDVENVSIHNL
jgi:hypothetical protein